MRFFLLLITLVLQSAIFSAPTLNKKYVKLAGFNVEKNFLQEVPKLKKFTLDIIINSDRYQLWVSDKSKKIQKKHYYSLFVEILKIKKSAEEKRYTHQIKILLKNELIPQLDIHANKLINQFDLYTSYRMALTEALFGKFLVKKKEAELIDYHFNRIHKLHQ